MEIFDKIKIKITKFKDLTAIGGSNLFGNVVTGVFWFYMASLLGAEKYGEISYLVAIAAISSTIASLGVGNTLTVFTAKKIPIQSSLFFVAFVSGLITSIILYLITANFAISLYIIGYSFFTCIFSEAIGKKSYLKYSKLFIVQRLLVPLIAIPLYLILDIFGILLGLALSTYFLIPIFIKTLKSSKVDLVTLKPYKNFLINSFGLDVSRILTAQLDKLIILPLFGLTLLGNYQLGIQFIAIVSIIPSSVYLYILPHESTGSSFAKLKFITILISVVMALLGIFLSPILLPILLPEFSQSIIMLQIMSVAIIPLTINQMYISKFLANELSKIVVIGSIIFVIIEMVSIITLGNYYGATGIAFSIVIAASSESIYLFYNTLQKRR